VLAPTGLTHTQFNLLASVNWLSRGGEPPTQQQVADMARADRMMASKVLTALEQRGLLTRRHHPGDTRAKRVEATAEGSALVSRAVRLGAPRPGAQPHPGVDPRTAECVARQRSPHTWRRSPPARPSACSC